MKLIIQQQDVFIDDEDYNLISMFNWIITKAGYVFTATTRKTRESLYLHRVIMGCIKGDGKTVDHINGDKLDNRRNNLRFCTQKENIINSCPYGEVEYKGVYRHRNKFRAGVTIRKKPLHLGAYNTKKEAALAVDKAYRKYYPDFLLRLNFPDEECRFPVKNVDYFDKGKRGPNRVKLKKTRT